MERFEKLTGADKLKSYAFIGIALLVAGAIGWGTADLGVSIPLSLIGGAFLILFTTYIFKKPIISLLCFVVYCFVGIGAARVLPTLPLGLGMDILLVLALIAITFKSFHGAGFKAAQNELTTFALLWFAINVLQLLNPFRGSPLGWFYGMRSASLYWLLLTPITFILFNERKHLNLFLDIIIGLSVFGTLYGIKQHFLGVSSFEQEWLDAGNAKTHILFGVLRVFSFYSDAGQFGASQAHIGLVALILAAGPHLTLKKKIIYGIIGGLLIYGFMISGTRGALFVILAGGLVYLILTKRTKALMLGLALGGFAFCFLKFTYIGQGNAEIRRMRTSLDLSDPSFQERLNNQRILREYLKTRPFGTGVGTIGNWGQTYNADRFISKIPPDSLFVKNWAEYGIIGFIIWFGIQLYILGKGGGIVWKLRDPELRQKILALTAGSAGILLASYGNEVQNQMPSSMIIYITWAFTYMAPKWDAQSAKSKNISKN